MTDSIKRNLQLARADLLCAQRMVHYGRLKGLTDRSGSAVARECYAHWIAARHAAADRVYALQIRVVANGVMS